MAFDKNISPVKIFAFSLTEICTPEQPHLITHVETTNATTADSNCTPAIHQALQDKHLCPQEHLVDTAYIDAPLLVETQQKYTIDLVGPVLPDSSWQARTPHGLHFTIDWAQHQARCPQGHLINSWEVGVDRWGQEVVRIHFPEQACQGCPLKAQCTSAFNKGRFLTLRPQAQHFALQRARQTQQSDEFKQRYATRS